ncbi:helix-turn-helix domain-containing protein [Bifidobacterium panos]|uniref:helix-turn-helix domain-containing protein n=1 Tax=Bifidobacterium panos TaxID=2675321 RepID=UPI003AA865BB
MHFTHEWCTRREAADYLHVSTQTIDRWRLQKRLTWRRVGPRMIRIRTDSIQRLLDWDYAA